MSDQYQDNKVMAAQQDMTTRLSSGGLPGSAGSSQLNMPSIVQVSRKVVNQLSNINTRLQACVDALYGARPETGKADAERATPPGRIGEMSDTLQQQLTLLGQIEQSAARLEGYTGAGMLNKVGQLG